MQSKNLSFSGHDPDAFFPCKGAGLNCIRRSVEYFNTDNFKAVRDAASSALPSGAYCAP